jgi:uncharacterized repeat protein (TIGR03803 family)
MQAANGDLYGTTCNGGTRGYGTVFTTTLAGALTVLHSFDNTDGACPYSALVQGRDGNFYGTTSMVGAGTVSKITPAGALTTLYGFCSESNCSDGSTPAGLVQASDGAFYGTTVFGGSNNNPTECSNSGCGIAFRITPSVY